MMKKLLYFIPALMLLASCGADGDGYSIKGTAGDIDGQATLSYATASGETVSQTADIKGGKFSFSGSVDDVYPATIVVIPSEGEPVTASLYVENAKIDVSLNLDDIVDYAAYGGLVFYNPLVSGGRNNEFVNAVSAARKAVGESSEFAEIFAAQEAIQKMGYADMAAYQQASAEFSEKYADLTGAYSQAGVAAVMECIKAHPDCEAAAYMFDIYSSSSSLEELEAGFASFTPEVQESFLAKDLRTEIEGRRSTAPGAVAPDFTLRDTDGNDVTLSELRGQYVLVDFWASWCKPCRAGVPGLKELYAKYHDKGFEILGVSDDSDHDAWKKAIEEDQSPWIHVCDEFPEENKPARVGALYATHYIPAYFLIDKEGVIIGQMDHDELAAKLAEIFD